MNHAERFAYHEDQVMLAVMAVDAARAAGDPVAEAAAIVLLEAADLARQQFRPIWLAAHRGDLEPELSRDRDPLFGRPQSCGP